MSVYNDVLDAVATRVQGLSLSLGAQSVTVEKRKLPVAQEGLDALPLVAVVPAPERTQFGRLGFEDCKEEVYAVDVVVIAAGNRDMLTNLDAYLGWLAQIRDLFRQAPLPGVPAVWDVRYNGATAIDRTLVNSDYDYSGISLAFAAVV